MTLDKYINSKYLDVASLNTLYNENKPFPHLVFKDFIDRDLLNAVESEYPDLEKLNSKEGFSNDKEVKFASKGYADLSSSAFRLVAFLNSDIFLRYLKSLTGIHETLICDPYLYGGGYHQIKKGGFLKVHVDYTKHPSLNLDRRVNLLIYLNKNWKSDWGGYLELYKYKHYEKPVISIKPEFNTCVIFSTTSYTYHGHPDKLNCPTDNSRRSLSLYYFSTGRPKDELQRKHLYANTTDFIGTKGEKINKKKYPFSFVMKNILNYSIKPLINDLTPPFLLRQIKKIIKKI